MTFSSFTLKMRQKDLSWKSEHSLAESSLDLDEKRREMK